MRPVIIGICGGGSGVGKTSVGCKILEKFSSWGAIKCTKTSLYNSVTDDLAVISQKGKDTRRFLDAGAGRVLLVQSTSYELSQVLPMAVEMLSHLPGVIVEGNSAVEVLRPDLVIFVAGSDGKIKEGAERALRMADILISDRELPGVPKRAKRFGMGEIGPTVEFIAASLSADKITRRNPGK